MRLRDAAFDPEAEGDPSADRFAIVGQGADPPGRPPLGGDSGRSGDTRDARVIELDGGDPVPARQWRVSGALTALKVVGASAFVVAGLIVVNTRPGAALGLVVASVLAGHALRDLVAPVRLRADRSGLTVVTGFSKRTSVPWSEVARVAVDERQRFGTRSRVLEIDTGDSLYLLGWSDLGAPVEEVAKELLEVSAAPDRGAAGRGH